MCTICASLCANVFMCVCLYVKVKCILRFREMKGFYNPALCLCVCWSVCLHLQNVLT